MNKIVNVFGPPHPIYVLKVFKGFYDYALHEFIFENILHLFIWDYELGL